MPEAHEWSLVYEGFDPKQEGLREALCTLGNGYFATRGAAPEQAADAVHYPGTYVAGVYNRLRSEVHGRTLENEDLVNLPNWLALTFRINGGPWFELKGVEILEYRQELDLRQGLLLRRVRFRDAADRVTTLEQRRLVHMRDPHLAVLETRITAENWSQPLEVYSTLDGRVVNSGVARYRNLENQHLEPVEERVSADILSLEVRASQSRVHVAESARTQLFRDGRRIDIRPTIIRTPGCVAERHLIEEMHEGETITIEKVVSLYTSRDRAVAECAVQSRQAVMRAPRVEQLVEQHVRAWAQLWNRFGVEITWRTGSRTAAHRLMTLRLHIFHLLQTVSSNTMDLDAGVPARGLHGEAYRGHIFWDELFIFPFLNLRVPEITRSLLMYRVRRLDEARVAARQAGYRGAMYPWQSGSDGREESQSYHLNPQSGRWIADASHLQRHINAAIAYNIWQYYQVTEDRGFMSFYGAEVLLEIARFWASVAAYNGERDRYEIHGLMGPNEYHEAYPGAREPGLDNNAYTNLMAAWVIWRALELLEVLPEDRVAELCEQLGLDVEERQLWDEVSRKMFVPFHGEGIISQFEGYEDLEEFDWATYRTKYDNIHRLDRILEAEGDTPNRYQISKQADALMLFYLFSAEELAALFKRLGYTFDPEWIPRNIDYYLQRTSHGSTLSQVVHAWVLARSDRSVSWDLFTEALAADVADVQGGTTPEGIHLGAMAGTVDLLQRGYTGIETRGGVLHFNPSLPDTLTRMRLNIHYRGHSVDVIVTHESIHVGVCPCDVGPIRIGVRGDVFELGSGEQRKLPLA